MKAIKKTSYSGAIQLGPEYSTSISDIAKKIIQLSKKYQN